MPPLAPCCHWPDAVRSTQWQVLRRVRGDLLHRLLHPGVPAAPGVHPGPQALRSQRAQHSGPGGHPAALPADGAGVLRGPGHPPALGGHRDGGPSREGNPNPGGRESTVCLAIGGGGGGASPSSWFSRWAKF